MTFAMMGALAWQVAISLIKFSFFVVLEGEIARGFDFFFFKLPRVLPLILCASFFFLCVSLCVRVHMSLPMTALPRLLPIATLHLPRLADHDSPSMSHRNRRCYHDSIL